MKSVCLILLFFLGAHFSHAQDTNWRKLTKSAEEKYKQGRYADAADMFMKAYKLKKRNDLLYSAGESYYRQRDYRKAARIFRKLRKDDNFQIAALQLGRCLKQDGQYKDAEKAFSNFIASYKGKDNKKLSAIVEREIEGCDLGLKELDKDDQDITLEMLSESINTIASEFAPVPFTDDVLYFSSTMEVDKARIFRSQRKAGNWSEAINPKFPNMPAGHFCNGSFSPDSRRFYFTICKENRSWNGPYAECDIYVTRRDGSNWLAPEKLRDYVKMDGSTATHPFVAHHKGQEVLYYATNRKGGQGGLDIWYTTRDLNSDALDYSLPQNAGSQINTPGDEVTPYYDAEEEVLYFSSNGHVQIGGYDIFRSRGSKEHWSNLQRLSGVYNSSYDDYYFVPPSSTHSGYLVSNRLFGLEKISTTQDDIFTFYTPQQSLAIGGKVFNNTNKNLLTDAEVTLYEVRGLDNKRLLNSLYTPDGHYAFKLIPQKKYVIEASKNGFATASHQFDTYANPSLSDHDFYLSQQDVAIIASLQTTNQLANPRPTAPSKKAKNNPTPTAPSSTYTAPKQATTPPRPAHDKPGLAQRRPANIDANSVRWSYIPKHRGVYFKVQCKAVVEFDPTEPQLTRVAEMGRLDTEYLLGKGLTRVLLAEFFTLDEAMAAVHKVRNLGFPDAFLVKYIDGRRVTP